MGAGSERRCFWVDGRQTLSYPDYGRVARDPGGTRQREGRAAAKDFG
jgi:hypothetical protein